MRLQEALNRDFHHKRMCALNIAITKRRDNRIFATVRSDFLVADAGYRL